MAVRPSSIRKLLTLAEAQATRRPQAKAAPKQADPRQGRIRAERPKTRKKRESTAWVRDYVFQRERDTCRLCATRRAESRHEIKARGAGGQITPENAIAACGIGTTGCHGFAQAHQIQIVDGPRVHPSDPRGAEGALLITPTSKAAAAWIGIPIGQTIESRPRYVAFQVRR